MAFSLIIAKNCRNVLTGRSLIAVSCHIKISRNEFSKIKMPKAFENLESRNAEFSPSRSRDVAGSNIDATHDAAHSTSFSGAENGKDQTLKFSDDHIDSYDKRGSVSLSSVMQTNVPEPYKADKGSPTHLNMPGGHWGQGDKYLSGDVHDHHYSKQPISAVDTGKKGMLKIRPPFYTQRCQPFHTSIVLKVEDNPPKELTRKSKLKQAVKDYGSTVIIFHITLSLASLGGFYLLVTSGIDVVGLIKSLHLDFGALDNKLTSDASTFVIAYAIHKIFAPARIGITLTAVPFIVNKLRKVGILKMPK